MGGQVLGGGVIALVAVLLWLVYLLPTWHSRMRYNAAERNAVRLNQALRVLAETSETPEEVRVELTAREAHAKQKLARKAQAERERLEKRLDQEEQRLRQERQRQRLEEERERLAAARRDPQLRRSRARRRMRLVASTVAFAGLAAAALGVWPILTTGVWAWTAAGAATALAGLVLLQRMSRVAARAARRERVATAGEAAPAQRLQTTLIDEADRGWQPRSLPTPMTSLQGSRAQAARAGAEEREALQRAAREEELRRRAERLRPAPVSLDTVRAADAPLSGQSEDAEIEAHVRELLARRAAG